MNLKEDILKLYNEGKSRKEICEVLKWAPSTIAYHLTSSFREKVYHLINKNRKEG